MEIRTLNACPDCARQFDVSYLKDGASVRCECGRRFAAEHRPARSPAVLRCTACGARLEVDATVCRYCSAQIALADRGLAMLCPGCFTRLPVRAKFCSACGLPIQPQALTALPPEARCPGCRGELRRRMVGERCLIECASCAGLWLTAAALEELCSRADQPYPELLALFKRRQRSDPGDGLGVTYRPCPVCGALMARRRFARRARLVIDCCLEHGMWLDHGELERILELARVGEIPDRLTRGLALGAARPSGLATATQVAPQGRTGRGPKRRRAGPASYLFDFVAQLVLELFT